MGHMSELKDRLRADLTTAIKARDDLRSSTLRMVLTAITNAEVAGKQARELTDEDVLALMQQNEDLTRRLRVAEQKLARIFRTLTDDPAATPELAPSTNTAPRV